MKHSGGDLLRRSIGGDVFFAIAAASDGCLRRLSRRPCAWHLRLRGPRRPKRGVREGHQRRSGQPDVRCHRYTESLRRRAHPARHLADAGAGRGRRPSVRHSRGRLARFGFRSDCGHPNLRIVGTYQFGLPVGWTFWSAIFVTERGTNGSPDGFWILPSVHSNRSVLGCGSLYFVNCGAGVSALPSTPIALRNSGTSASGMSKVATYTSCSPSVISLDHDTVPSGRIPTFPTGTFEKWALRRNLPKPPFH